MIAMSSTTTGEVSGPGVKPSRSARCPSTKIHVRIPSVAPRPSRFMIAALMGSTSEPNARNIRIVVATSTYNTNHGSPSTSASTESDSMAGFPPTWTSVPAGIGNCCRYSTVSVGELRSTRPDCRTTTSRPWSSCCPDRANWNGPVSPGALLASARICESVVPSEPITTSLTGSVRVPGKFWSYCSCATRVVLSGGR